MENSSSQWSKIREARHRRIPRSCQRNVWDALDDTRRESVRQRLMLEKSTRLQYFGRLERDLTAILVLVPTNCHGKRLKKRYLQFRDCLFTFLRHPDVPPNNRGCSGGNVEF
jgi:hypothetical protein